MALDILEEGHSSALLDSLEGVSYVLDFNGTINSIGRTNWDAAAQMGNAHHLKTEALIGANLFDFIAGEDSVSFYRGSFLDLQTGRRRQIAFEYRCDSPHVRREMRMCRSCVRDKGRPTGILCQSLVISEDLRPPMKLFDAEYMRQMYEAEKQLPLITMCSYCHRVKAKAGSESWQSAEEYYHAGGTERVRISHGMCVTCYGKLRAAREVKKPKPGPQL